MLYDIALIPGVFAANAVASLQAELALRDFLKDLALCNGHVADLEEGHWRRSVRDCVGTLPQQLRLDVQACLARLSDRGCLPPRSKVLKERPSSDAQWQSAVDRSHRLRPFDFIVSGGDGYGAQEIRYSFAEVAASALWRESNKPSLSLNKIELDFRYWLDRLVCYSQEVWLIDKLMHPSRKAYGTTIGLCAQAIGCALPRRSQRTVCIHVQYPESYLVPIEKTYSSCHKLLEGWKKNLGTVAQRHRVRGVRFEVLVWPAPIRHDRCVLTNTVSIEVPSGLDPRLNDEDVKGWYKLDDTVEKHIRDHYHPRDCQDRLVGKLEMGTDGAHSLRVF